MTARAHRIATGNARLSTPPSDAVAASFDAIAPVFDIQLENETTVQIRQKVYRLIESLINPGDTILDINCGTGIDAINLSGKGYRVTGIDISPGMISEAKKKIAALFPGGPEFSVGSYERISPADCPPVDLAFSNFGGLNCTRNIRLVSERVASVLRPGGYFIGVIMPTFSLWEFLSYILRFRLSDAFRRSRTSVPATGFGALTFPVYYHSVSSVRRAFARDFSVRRIIGVNILSPTPQSAGFYREHRFLSAFLSTVDSAIESLPIVRRAGDHFIIVLRKKS